MTLNRWELSSELELASFPGQVIACVWRAQIHDCRLVHRRRGACHADADGGQVFSAMRELSRCPSRNWPVKTQQRVVKIGALPQELEGPSKSFVALPFSSWSDRLRVPNASSLRRTLQRSTIKKTAAFARSDRCLDIGVAGIACSDRGHAGVQLRAVFLRGAG